MVKQYCFSGSFLRKRASGLMKDASVSSLVLDQMHKENTRSGTNPPTAVLEKKKEDLNANVTTTISNYNQPEADAKAHPG